MRRAGRDVARVVLGAALLLLCMANALPHKGLVGLDLEAADVFEQAEQTGLGLVDLEGPNKGVPQSFAFFDNAALGANHTSALIAALMHKLASHIALFAPLLDNDDLVSNHTIGDPGHPEPAAAPAFECVPGVDMRAPGENHQAPRFLPDSVAPSNYRLLFAVDPSRNFLFVVTLIQATVNKATSVITLNVGSDLCFQKAVVYVQDHPVPASFIRDDATDHLEVHTAHTLQPGSVALLFVHTMPLTVDHATSGMYGSTMTDANGGTSVVVSTQFEPIGARHAFPCFDAPHFKATFDVSVQVPTTQPALTVLGNMPEIEHGVSNGVFDSAARAVGEQFFPRAARTVHFATTPLMSTYLLAVVVGELDHVQSSAFVGRPEAIPVRCFGPVGFRDHMKDALQAAVASLQFFTRYFGTSYSLPKMDLVAIPNFSSGAMENWGLVLYHQQGMIVDPASDSHRHRTRVVEVVFHENAHQWFGNLVTLHDWDELYLNEGFANYMETFALEWMFDGKFPSWAMFSVSTMEGAKQADALLSTHAISKTRGVDGEISSEMFNAISYNKGASLLYMLRTVMTAVEKGSFEAGVQAYIRKHALANTRSHDLWTALGKAANKDIPRLMEQWTTQAGFPLVIAKYQPASCSIRLQQRRFVNGYHVLDADVKAEHTTLWSIPLFINVHSGGHDHIRLVMMEEKEHVLTCDKLGFSGSECCLEGKDTWVKLNWRETGMYRVWYDDVLTSKLVDGWDDLSEDNRAGLALDAFANNVYCPGSTPITVFLDAVVRAWERKDRSCVVWTALASRLGWIDRALSGHEGFDEWRQFVHAVVRDLVKDLGLLAKQGEDVTRTALRVQVLSLAVSCEEPTTVTALARALAQSQRNKTPLPESIRALVLTSAVIADRHPQVVGVETRADSVDGNGALQWVLDKVQEDEPVVHQECLMAAMRTTDSSVVPALMEFGATKVRASEFPDVISALIANPHTREVAWAYVREHFQEITHRLDGNSFEVLEALGVMNSPEHLEEVKAFLKTAGEGLLRTKDGVVESIQGKVVWSQHNAEPLRKFIASLE